MSASEEFLRLVDLRGDYECAVSNGEALDEVVRVKRLYESLVASYAAEHGTTAFMVEVAVDEACDALAKHDRLMAAIEDTLREQH